VNHLPIAKKTYTEKAASKFQISPLDGAQYESILANNIQRSNKKKRYTKENTTRLRPRKTPQHKSTRNQPKTLKFSTKFIQATKHDTSLSLRCSRKDRMTGNKLYEANHLCMMKLAIINEETTRQPPPKDIIHP
jgi:hypothetical protein